MNIKIRLTIWDPYLEEHQAVREVNRAINKWLYSFGNEKFTVVRF